MSDLTPSIRIRADELRTVREAMRDLSSLLTELEDGDLDKVVLTQRNRLRAVVVSLEHWSRLERALGHGQSPPDAAPAPQPAEPIPRE